MVLSRIVAEDGTTIDFAADKSYSLSWALFYSQEYGDLEGRGLLASGGDSLLKIGMTGHLLTNESEEDPGKSADWLLWNKLKLIGTEKTSDELKHTLFLELGNGVLEAEGWMTDFIADRDAPDGLAEIPVSIEFLIETAFFTES